MYGYPLLLVDVPFLGVPLWFLFLLFVVFACFLSTHLDSDWFLYNLRNSAFITPRSPPYLRARKKDLFSWYCPIFSPGTGTIFAGKVRFRVLAQEATRRSITLEFHVQAFTDRLLVSAWTVVYFSPWQQQQAILAILMWFIFWSSESIRTSIGCNADCGAAAMVCCRAYMSMVCCCNAGVQGQGAMEQKRKASKFFASSPPGWFFFNF